MIDTWGRVRVSRVRVRARVRFMIRSNCVGHLGTSNPKPKPKPTPKPKHNPKPYNPINP